MSNRTRAVLALCWLVAMAACAPTEQVVYVDEPAITAGPVYTGKFK